MVSTYGLRWKQRRFGGIFEAELASFRDREQFSKDEWQAYVSARFRQLIVHAYDTVPFYRESIAKRGLRRADLEKMELSAIDRLPLLDKNDLRQYGISRLVSSVRERHGHFFSSSGSTGTPTQILFSFPMHQRWSAAFESRIRHWAGVDRFTPRGMIGGRRVVPDGAASAPFYRFNWFEKQTYFSAYHISPETAPNYVDGMIRHKVEYMTGYAMSNYFLARFIEERGIPAPRMKAVITSSEKLTDEMRTAFQRVYGCKTFDSWSGIEACGLVSECEHGNLHISPDVGIVEILDTDGQPVRPGEIGEVVCTGLLNFDQPLIRYRIGDEMRLGKGDCSCGRNMPVIEEIVGRVEDTVVGKDGREMVRFHGIFIDLPNLRNAQVIQWELDRIEIKVVTNGKWSSGESDLIRQRLISQLGEVRIEINEVPQIQLSSNGKFKAVISHVKRKASR